jgi:hypothetical protein
MTTCGSYVVLKEKHPGLLHEQKPEADCKEIKPEASWTRSSAVCIVASLSITTPLRSGITGLVRVANRRTQKQLP